MAKTWRKLFCVFIVCFLPCFIFVHPAISESDGTKTPVSVGPVQQINQYYGTQTTTYSDGTSITRHIINGPPKPPAGYEPVSVALPEPNPEMGTSSLTVPTFNWVFGCSSVSGAMIAGYYDRNGYSNMYTGPTDGGVMPLDNSSWGTWSDGVDTYPHLPLAASHNGVDGRVTKGSIDDYWIGYGSTADDPYITGAWTQHTWSDGQAIGDYMKTSQSYYSNTDGSTSFYGYTSSASPLTCSDMVGYLINTLDGTYGRKLFYEARGYTVTDCYSQKTDNTVAGGFSFAQYKAEIDAGRPVMLNMASATAGHTVVGVGYNDTSNTVYLHDTWHQDGTTQSMTWTGTFSGYAMTLRSVSIVNLATPLTTDTQLSNGVALDQTMTAPVLQGTWRYYYIDIPSGSKNLVIDLYNLTADLDLYVRQGSKPTLSSYTCRHWKGSTNSESCTFSSPTSGRWWIGVNNYATGTNSYTVKAMWSKGKGLPWLLLLLQ